MITESIERIFITFKDANTKRDQGKKAQMSNIFAAKVIPELLINTKLR